MEVVGIIVIVALVLGWVLAEKVLERGFDEVWDWVSRRFSTKKSPETDTRSSMIIRDKAEHGE